jgi:hypothetical protein
MPTLIFRCPVTGHNVQGWIAEETGADASQQQVFVTVRCGACGRTHPVNPATAEVLGNARRTPKP